MAEKDHEEDDPFELVGVRLADAEAEAALNEMARVFVEEFARMGYARERILSMFHDPFYRAPHEVLRRRGEAFVLFLLEGVP